MGKKKQESTEQKIATLEKALDESIQHWKYLKRYGCSDPFYEDGTNLNLVRNHIIHYLIEIDKLRQEPLQLKILENEHDARIRHIMSDPRIPPEYDDTFMANNRKMAIEREEDE